MVAAVVVTEPALSLSLAVGKKPHISGPLYVSSTAHHLVSPGHHQVAPPSATSPQRSQSAFYTPVSKVSTAQVTGVALVLEGCELQ